VPKDSSAAFSTADGLGVAVLVGSVEDIMVRVLCPRRCRFSLSRCR
jgi:hypothetical protein